MRVLPMLAASLLAVAFAAPFAAGAAAATSPSVTLQGHRFSMELATTPAEQEHGLMDRTSMPARHGMLFIFPRTEPRTFWMKNTLIPLDMVFLDAARRVVAIQADALPCKADPCELYPSEAPARYVIELNAGTAAKIGLRKGDAVKFSGMPADVQ